MEFGTHQFQIIKLAVHIAQGLFIFVSWAIMIAVWKAKSSVVEGRTGWYFGLCFLTIPALIYLTMTPRFPRTRKLANPYAMAAVDGIFCILWLSAFAAVANYNSDDKCGNACGLSKAVVGLGVFIWLFFVLTTLLSVYAVIYYRREGYLPGGSRAPTNTQMIDPDKAAFSTAPHDDEYAPVHDIDEHEGHDIHGPSTTYDAPSYGGGYVPPSVSDDTAYTGYTGAQGLGRQSPMVGDNGRVHFPAARYDNV